MKRKLEEEPGSNFCTDCLTLKAAGDQASRAACGYTQLCGLRVASRSASRGACACGRLCVRLHSCLHVCALAFCVRFHVISSHGKAFFTFYFEPICLYVLNDFLVVTYTCLGLNFLSGLKAFVF